MGNSTGHIFDKHNWQFVSKPSTFDIVQDQKTGIQAQKHIIPNNPTITQHDQMEVYRYRNLTNKPIVKVYDAQYVENKAGGACGAAKNIVIHTQYIPHRLSDTKNLNHGQGLYVLSQALAGFHQLHYRFGPFQITDDHIGFNQIGQTKVWHSPNFASNHLNGDNIILMSTANPKNFDQRMEKRQEQQMVEDIWMAVDQHANLSPEFTSRANSFRQKSFVEARQIVAEQILRDNTYVPQYLNFDGLNQRISTAQRFTAQSHVQPVNLHTNIPVNSTSYINLSSPMNTREFRTSQSNIVSHPVGQTHYNIPQNTLVYQTNNPVYQSHYAVSGNLPPRQLTTINQLDPFVHTTPVSAQYSGQYRTNFARSQQTLPVFTQQPIQQNYTFDPRYQTTSSAFYNQPNKVYSNNSNLNVVNQTNVGNYGQRENVYLG